MGEQPFLNRDYHTTAESFFNPTNSQPYIAFTMLTHFKLSKWAENSLLLYAAI
jgi:hypothetical protein